MTTACLATWEVTSVMHLQWVMLVRGRDMALVLVLSQVSHTFLFAAVSKLYLSFFVSNIAETCTQRPLRKISFSFMPY